MVNWKTAFVLVVLLVGLGAYAFISRPSAAPGRFGRILPCSQTTSVLVRVERQGKVLNIVRAKPGDPWRITEPVDGIADPNSMQTLTQSLNSVEALNTIAHPEPASTYGLDAPNRVVTCRVNGGDSYTLYVGNESFDGSGYYAQKAGDNRVYVIGSTPIDEFDRELAEPPVMAPPAGVSPRPT